MRDLVVRVQPFATAVLYRSVFAWLGVRIFLAVFVGVPVFLSPGAALALVLVVGALGLLDARRRNEDLFLANLGVSRPQIGLTAAMPALVFELVLAAVKYL